MAWTGPKILGAIAVTTEHLQTIARLSLPSPGCLQPVRCPSKSRKKEPSQEGENQERTDGHESGFLVDAVSNLRIVTSQRKRKETTIIRGRPISAGTSLLRGSASVLFFFRVHYILANRRNENVSDNNSFSDDPRARDVLQSLSRPVYAIIPRSRLL